MRGHNERTNLISPWEIIGVHFFGKGMIPFKVNLKGAQGLDGSLFTPTHRGTMHHVVVEPVRVLQRKELALSNKAVSSPYLSLQFTDGEECIGDLVRLFHLDRIVLRERRGASRHLERSELAFNIEGDNPEPTLEADIVCSKQG
jgi:hypothetical protein